MQLFKHADMYFEKSHFAVLQFTPRWLTIVVNAGLAESSIAKSKIVA